MDDAKLRQRIFEYLVDGQKINRNLAIEVADNVTDVVEEWLRDMAELLYEEDQRDDCFSLLQLETREEYEKKKVACG